MVDSYRFHSQIEYCKRYMCLTRSTPTPLVCNSLFLLFLLSFRKFSNAVDSGWWEWREYGFSPTANTNPCTAVCPLLSFWYLM